MDSIYHGKLINKAVESWENINCFYNHKKFLNFIKLNLGGLHYNAIITGFLNYQVENGGFYQWRDNGYSISIDDLINFFKSFTNDKIINNVIQILEDVKSQIEWLEDGYKVLDKISNDSYNDIFENALEDAFSRELDFSTRNYYKINEKLMEILEDYFEKEMNKIENGENEDCYFNYFE